MGFEPEIMLVRVEARVVKRCCWVARVDLQVEWASEVVCATWEEIREEVEGAEAEALLLAV